MCFQNKLNGLCKVDQSGCAGFFVFETYVHLFRSPNVRLLQNSILFIDFNAPHDHELEVFNQISLLQNTKDPDTEGVILTDSWQNPQLANEHVAIFHTPRHLRFCTLLLDVSRHFIFANQVRVTFAGSNVRSFTSQSTARSNQSAV